MSRRRIRRPIVGQTCHRCGGRLKPYAGGEYVQCTRCKRAEWRPSLAPAERTALARKEAP